MEKLLPNGTIVLLIGGNKRLMTYGRKQLIVDNDQEEAAEGIKRCIGFPTHSSFIHIELC